LLKAKIEQANSRTGEQATKNPVCLRSTFNCSTAQNKNVIQGANMKVKIDDSCTACGLCVETCPEVFRMGDTVAEVIVQQVPPQFEDAAQQAADECPVEAIAVE
jgi:ferredoxin